MTTLAVKAERQKSGRGGLPASFDGGPRGGGPRGPEKRGPEKRGETKGSGKEGRDQGVRKRGTRGYAGNENEGLVTRHKHASKKKKSTTLLCLVSPLYLLFKANCPYQRSSPHYKMSPTMPPANAHCIPVTVLAAWPRPVQCPATRPSTHTHAREASSPRAGVRPAAVPAARRPRRRPRPAPHHGPGN